MFSWFLIGITRFFPLAGHGSPSVFRVAFPDDLKKDPAMDDPPADNQLDQVSSSNIFTVLEDGDRAYFGLVFNTTLESFLQHARIVRHPRSVFPSSARIVHLL